MKKVIALLAAVIVLAGGVEMTASAAATACEHSSHWKKEGDNYIETYTHSVQVGTSTSGKPILAACLVEIEWHPYYRVCNFCQEVIASYKVKVREDHSMH